jgi:peptidoglycan/LPS O-acetylase OafA/YrhL
MAHPDLAISAPGKPATPAPPQARKYRPELQGVRAVAATLVVLYHVWFNRVSGGVDVFFLISGFLITGQLVRAVEGKGIQFRAMWGRMLKRLLPAALTVLAASMVLGVLILPQDRWLQTIKEVIASALYFENWQLAADSVDYFAKHNTASVSQHYWSMSIQGQFYLVWPLLFLGLGLLARKLRRDFRTIVFASLVVLFVVSIAYSVYLTRVNQPLAYFHSLTRVWEFALGGLFGMAIDRIVLPRGLRIAMGWLGLVGLVSCGALLRVETVFPGWIALWPTVSAAMVIVAGDTGSKAGADRFLGSKPLEYLGNISYGLYLWHWPVMLFWLLYMDRTEIGARGGLMLIAVSFALAMVTYHFVEKPVRFSKIGIEKPWGAYRFAVLVLVPTLLMAGVWQVYSGEKVSSERLQAVGDVNHPGAMAMDAGFKYQGDDEDDVSLVPSPVALPKDWGSVANADCRKLVRFDPKASKCTSRVNGTPTKRIMVIGDSHSEQYLSAFNELAAKNHWQITAMLMGACPFSTGSELSPGNHACEGFNAEALRQIKADKPDLVVGMASMEVHKGLKERTPKGFVDAWRKVNALGIPVAAIRDSPRYESSPPACAEKRGPQDPSCAGKRAELLADEAPYEKYEKPADTHFFDFSDYLCDEKLCPPVLGNVYVYMDDNHLSATYLRTLSPVLERKIKQSLSW